MNTFIEDLLEEVEKKEDQNEEVWYDLMLLEIRELTESIEKHFTQAEQEIAIINQWALKKNAKLQERKELLEKRLEAFIQERGEKTIDLPNGTLKYHKKPDKVEITDMETFLKEAKSELLKLIPEQLKPDLTKIKAYIKIHTPPKGVTVTEGKETFSYKLRKEADNARTEET